MTIENLELFIGSLPDWAILNGCFPGRIRPSDIDGWVEKDGRSLFLEHKRPDAPLKQGQAIGFKSLATQGNTVMVYWSEGEEVERLLVFYGSKRYELAPATLEDLRYWVAKWATGRGVLPLG